VSPRITHRRRASGALLYGQEGDGWPQFYKISPRFSFVGPALPSPRTTGTTKESHSEVRDFRFAGGMLHLRLECRDIRVRPQPIPNADSVCINIPSNRVGKSHVKDAQVDVRTPGGDANIVSATPQHTAANTQFDVESRCRRTRASGRAMKKLATHDRGHRGRQKKKISS